MTIIQAIYRQQLPILWLSGLLSGCFLASLLVPSQLHAAERLIFEEGWEWDEVGALSSQLSFWRKLTGFEASFAQVIQLPDHDQRKALKFSADASAAPLMTKDQFSAGKQVSLEMVFVRESERGSWLRLSLLSGSNRDSGYFLQIYPNQIELVCVTPENGTTILGTHRFTAGAFPPGQAIKVTLQVDTTSHKASVLLDDHAVLVFENFQQPDLGSAVRIGLRSQPDVEVWVESLKLFSERL